KNASLVFEGMAIRNVSDIVQKSRGRDYLLGVRIDGRGRAGRHMISPYRFNNSLCRPTSAERVFKTGMHRAGIYERRGPQLFNAAQALHLWSIDKLHLFAREYNIAVHWIANDFVAHKKLCDLRD